MGEHVERIEAWKEEVPYEDCDSKCGHGISGYTGAWQDNHSTPAGRLAELYRAARLTDTTIIMPGLIQPLKVHRLVLSMSSSVFEAMLLGSMAEGDVLELPDDPVDAFKWMLNYMYTGEREISSVNLCVQIYQLANKYMMKDLVDLCSQYLLTNVSAVNLPLVFNMATLLNDQKLLKKCMQVFKVSTDSVLTSPDFCELTRESLRELLIGKELHVTSEVLLFNALTTWGKAQMELEIQENNNHNCLREELEEFIPLVRFLNMDLMEFKEHVEPTKIFTAEEIQIIRENISAGNNPQLPEILSKSRRKRRKFMDEVHLKNLTLYDGPDMTKDIIYNSGEERVLISEFKLKKNICLSKLEYSANFCHSNAPNRIVTVCDNDDTELVSVPFIGKVAKFIEPFEIIAGKYYSFKLKEGIPYNLVQTSWNIVSANGMASGKKHFWNYPVTLYFWDK